MFKYEIVIIFLQLQGVFGSWYQFQNNKRTWIGYVKLAHLLVFDDVRHTSVNKSKMMQNTCRIWLKVLLQYIWIKKPF